MSLPFRLLLAFVGLCVVWGSILPTVLSAGADEAVAAADGADRSCRSDCPGDDENGECPPDCDACPCCPSSASPAVSCDGPAASPGEALAAARPTGDPGQALEGPLSRVFHPPRRAAS